MKTTSSETSSKLKESMKDMMDSDMKALSRSSKGAETGDSNDLRALGKVEDKKRNLEA